MYYIIYKYDKTFDEAPQYSGKLMMAVDWAPETYYASLSYWTMPDEVHLCW